MSTDTRKRIPLFDIFNGRRRRLGEGSHNSYFAQIDVAFREYHHAFYKARLHVFMELLLHSDENGHCNPSIKRMSHNSGYSRRVVSDTLEQLCNMYIEGERLLLCVNNGRDGDGTWANNDYIIFPSPEDLEKYPPEHQRYFDPARREDVYLEDNTPDEELEDLDDDAEPEIKKQPGYFSADGKKHRAVKSNNKNNQVTKKKNTIGNFVPEIKNSPEEDTGKVLPFKSPTPGLEVTVEDAPAKEEVKEQPKKKGNEPLYVPERDKVMSDFMWYSYLLELKDKADSQGKKFLNPKDETGRNISHAYIIGLYMVKLYPRFFTNPDGTPFVPQPTQINAMASKLPRKYHELIALVKNSHKKNVDDPMKYVWKIVMAEAGKANTTANEGKESAPVVVKANVPDAIEGEEENELLQLNPGESWEQKLKMHRMALRYTRELPIQTVYHEKKIAELEKAIRKIETHIAQRPIAS